MFLWQRENCPHRIFFFSWGVREISFNAEEQLPDYRGYWHASFIYLCSHEFAGPLNMERKNAAFSTKDGESNQRKTVKLELHFMLKSKKNYEIAGWSRDLGSCLTLNVCYFGSRQVPWNSEEQIFCVSKGQVLGRLTSLALQTSVGNWLETCSAFIWEQPAGCPFWAAVPWQFWCGTVKPVEIISFLSFTEGCCACSWAALAILNHNGV